MKLIDVTTITKQLVAEVLGTTYMEQNGYLEAIPAEKLVDIGKDVTNTVATTERAINSMIVLLTRHEIEVADYAKLFGSIQVTREEWGGFIERTKLKIADIMEDPMLNLSDGVSYADKEHTYYKPKALTKIYDEGKGIVIPISIQKSMLTEAFQSYEAMNSFQSKVLACVRATLDTVVDRYASALVCGAIVISAKTTGTAIHLITEAIEKNILEAGTTAEKALDNKAFLTFVAKRIGEVRKNMRVMSTAYNNKALPIGSGDQYCYLLTALDQSLRANLMSGTFNRDDLSFGEYESVPLWQAMKAAESDGDFNYATCSTVSLAADPDNKLGAGTAAVKVENVVGLCCSKKAIGITLYKEYVTQTYTAVGDFWNNFTHVLTNQILDPDYPIVAFLLD